MAIISRIGRKSLKSRLLIWTIYALLTAGSVTMLYPFLLMISGSTKSAVDSPKFLVIPRFLRNNRALYQKYIECFFNESLESMNIAYNTAFPAFDQVEPPSKPNPRLVKEWQRFLTENPLPDHCYMIEATNAPVTRAVLPYRLRQFKSQLIHRFHGDIDKMNRELDSDYYNWNAFYVLSEDFLQRRNHPGGRPFDREFWKYKRVLPLASRYYFSPEGFFKTSYLKTQYTKELDTYNKDHGTSYKSWDEIHLDRRVPTGPGRTRKEREDWETFVRTILNLFWIRADREAAPLYRGFLQAKYRTIDSFNRRYGTHYNSYDLVPILQVVPDEGLALSDWDAFVQGWDDPDTGKEYKLPVEMIGIHSVDFMFRDYLEHKYGSLAAANSDLGTQVKDWVEILPPQRDLHYTAFAGKTGFWRKEFLTRNFSTVFDYIVLHGRGLRNTAIYCSLAILAALIVNPLAAYALSRYRPAFTYKVLLFLMMTMAFPPMVTQIPAFLMLREFNLLNTFWALILPGLANGYSIFLLKGFFDSLPKELYESADLDGAGEFRIFWQLTMCLSTPILAVIALNAFTYAYSNFGMALLICQDERMWTLMPWLYQLQQRSGEGVIMASLLVAAMPTFLVFAFCQNVIMRGIVVPVEK